MLADFPVTIDYTQVLVQAEDRAAHGLLWTDDHVVQGFAWSQGHVSFDVPDHDGECRIEVDLGHYPATETTQMLVRGHCAWRRNAVVLSLSKRIRCGIGKPAPFRKEAPYRRKTNPRQATGAQPELGAV
jgi:hypothetical protein